MIPLINGKAYNYAQVVVRILGAPLISVSAITYAETQEKVNNYGAGGRPVSRGHGTVKATASVTISMNDIEALREVAPEGSLLKIPPFDVEVSYLNEQKVVNHVVKSCEFLEDGVETQVDDTDIKRAFPLIPSHIKWS